MNREENCLDTKHCEVKGKRCTTSSSDYTTCSDNPIENVNIKRRNLQERLHSVILAGHVPECDEIESPKTNSLIFNLPINDINTESSSSLNVLDQNLDVIMENSDIFIDCNNVSQSDTYNDESTKYLQIEPMTNLLEMKSKNHFYANYSNLNKLDTDNKKVLENSLSMTPVNPQIENERLRTIMEETEIIHSNISFLKNQTLKNIQNNTMDSGLEMIGESKCYNEISNCDKNSMRRVLFANEKNNQDNSKLHKSKDKKIITKNSDNSKLYKLKDKKVGKCSNFQLKKGRCCSRKERDINENCNSTESFLLWEKFCNISNNLNTRRSYSFSELNSVNDCYTGDDEYSSSFKSLDDTFVSHLSFETNERNFIQKRYIIHKSKSCESLLKEVKHLPHILYDKFLKSLAKEIESIRKQNVVCTCQTELNQKLSNKENHERSSKSSLKSPIIQITNGKSIGKTKLLSQISPVKVVTNQSKLSPETVKNLSQDVHTLSPKPLDKTPTTPSKKRGLYSWQKEIVSPVGEYIRGKRQSPFKTSPNKRKL